MIENWIFSDNLHSFLTTLSWIVESDFDDDDWVAISNGVQVSNGDPGELYEYEFSGRHCAKLTLQHESGTSVVLIAVDVPDEIMAEVRLAMGIFQHFHLH